MLTQARVAQLSSAFVFGVGHEARPIPDFLTAEAIAFGAYFVAVEIVRRTATRRWHLAWVFAVALLCRFFLVPSSLIQEVDPYRYVWDGQAVIQGANPYVLSPKEALDSGAPPAIDMEGAAARVYERVSYEEVPTLYPPLAQAWFALAQLLTPWELGGWRVLVLVADVATMVLLAFGLLGLGRPLAWVVVYAWSPLILKETSNGLHLDVVAVLGLAAMILAVLRGRAIAAFVALAWTALVKVFAVALVPVLAALAWSRRPRSAVLGMAVFAVLVAVAYLPWADARGELFEGLFAFAERWQRNASIFAAAQLVVGDLARPLCGLLILAAVGGATVAVVRHPDPMRANGAALAVIVAIFLFAPTSNPWYFTWAVPFLVFFPSRALLLLSGLLFLYYAEFHFLYRDQPERLAALHLLEYVPFYLALGVEIWDARRRRVALGG